MRMSHPSETELALLASGDCGAWARFTASRHVRSCEECREKVAEFSGIREETAQMPEPDLHWEALAAEMRANIHLGLEAGECIRAVQPAARWNPKLVVAFASMLLIVGASIVMHKPLVPVQTAATVLESNGSGLEVRSKAGSLTLLNHHGAVADQTVSAQGAIRARYVDGEAGTVTINNVYFE